MAHKKAKILIVDDIEQNRKILKELVEFNGHLPLTAENGLVAIEMMEGDLPDLVLLDIFMPHMDGYEVLSRMKADERLHLIPVLMVTAMDEIESVVRCLERGADDYMVKPFNTALLQARIKGCLEKKRLIDKNSELLQTVLKQQAQMDMEMDLAQKVQEAMLPSKEYLSSFKKFDVAAYYKAATSIGGDFYDCFEYGTDKAAFLLADVSGHGPAAALTVSALRTIIEDEKKHCPYPGQFMNILNVKLKKVIPEDCFATIFFCVADFAAKRLTFVCAGHPAPYLIRANKVERGAFDVPGMPVGIIEDATFNESSIDFLSGDKLIVYSDGTYETKDESGNLYGMERFEDRVKAFSKEPPSKIIDGIVDDVQKHWDGKSERDDIAIVAIEFS